MSPIVREAVRTVRESGDFTLLDCLELIERRAAGEKDAVATCRWLGHTLIGYGAVDKDSRVDDCEACDGDGELAARGGNGQTYYFDCPECDGEGSVDSGECESVAESLEWKTLNGEPASPDLAALTLTSLSFRTHHDAHSLVDKTSKQLREAA